jgi:hypothetical protein
MPSSNGATARLPLVELEFSSASIRAEATAPSPGAPPGPASAGLNSTGGEALIGAAVASAATAICCAVQQQHQQNGRLDPAVKLAGGERIAKVAELWLAHEGDDLEFTRKARDAAKCVLRQYFDADFYRHYSPEQGDAALDWFIDPVLEIAACVVRDERAFRAAWAN